MRKSKLSVNEQITHMKNKGILFNISTEIEAKNFLTNNNYYFKVKAFAKNFDKYQTGEKEGKYINLDFSYLRDLSTLDMYLRKVILKMTLDIEHFLKAKLLTHFADNELEDGYTIIDEFLTKFEYINNNINNKKNNSTCKFMIDKYYNDFALWNIIEVLSFGDFIKLYELYFSRYDDEDEVYKNNYLSCVRFLRNAAAHNNCLLNSLRKPYSLQIEPNNHISNMVAKIPSMSKSIRGQKLKNHIIHDFVTMLYVYDIVINSKEVKYYTLKELKELVDNRFTRNKNYYDKVSIIKENYIFVKIIVDYFFDIAYNNIEEQKL